MSTPRVGLVLGAGGVAGVAFHAGVLAGLAEGIGWDPRRAELVVGTSAGSITGAGLRAGLSAFDIAARAEGTPLSAEGARLLEGLPLTGDPGTEPVVRFPGVAPAAPRVLVAAGMRPWKIRPGAVLAGLLPAGRVSTAAIEEGVGALFGDRWPESRLWLCALRLDAGRLTVFGRQGAPPATVGEAVAASCAIPAYFAPVMIGGVRYVDGGAHSLTNLAQVARQHLDLVVVSAPISRAGRRRRVAGGVLVREVGRIELGIEARRVRLGGTAVIAFAPTAEDQAAMGPNPMDPRRQAAIVRQARTSTLRRLERTDVRRRLEALAV